MEIKRKYQERKDCKERYFVKRGRSNENGRKEKYRQKKRNIIYKLLRITGVHKTGRKVPAATKFCTVATNICGISLRNLFHVTHLAPGILR
jgi:hypothetical protein